MDAVWKKLYEYAKNTIDPHEVSEYIYVGSVAAAILTKKGNIYTGVCIDTSCSLGMCAERNALSTMLTQGEHEVDRVVAVYKDGTVMPPCGACREFMMQLPGGKDIEILVDDNRKAVRLADLMPEYPY